MDAERIAKILYNMSLDMDYVDGIEYATEVIKAIAAELVIIKNSKCDSLLQALENIALKNKSMEFWKEGIEHE